MSIQARANRWIADSGDDTKELREAAEIMAGLVAEIEKCKQSAIKLEYREIEQKAAEFFDWPTNNRDFVTSTSAILFAVSMIQAYCHSDEAVEKKCRDLESQIDTLVTLLVDAELITKSRAKELTGQSIQHWAQAMANSPIRQAALEESIKVIQDAASDYCACEQDKRCRACISAEQAIDVLRKAAQEVTT